MQKNIKLTHDETGTPMLIDINSIMFLAGNENRETGASVTSLYMKYGETVLHVKETFDEVEAKIAAFSQ